MDPNAAPWRALEAATPEPAAREAASVPLPSSWIAPAAMLAAVALAVVAFIVAAGGTDSGGLQVKDDPIGIASPAIEAGTDPRGTASIVVHIVGAVRDPGVYRLDPGARVADLVERAGGYGPRVDVDRAVRELNLAALLTDGEQVRVPSRDDPSPEPATAVGPAGGDGHGAAASISLNRASSSELETLPGIGPVTAGKIIAAREEQPFTSVDELRGRRIVGEKTFEKIRDLVTAD